MAVKLALNTLYTIGIVLCIITMYWGFGNRHYDYMLIALFVAALFVYLKIKILKEVKNSQKP
jgi:hypothetical protein